MDYLAAMHAFVRTVDLGSFSKVADEMEVKDSTVSRFVSALEDDPGAALLNRSTRALQNKARLTRRRPRWLCQVYLRPEMLQNAICTRDHKGE